MAQDGALQALVELCIYKANSKEGYLWPLDFCNVLPGSELKCLPFIARYHPYLGTEQEGFMIKDNLQRHVTSITSLQDSVQIVVADSTLTLRKLYYENTVTSNGQPFNPGLEIGSQRREAFLVKNGGALVISPRCDLVDGTPVLRISRHTEKESISK